MRILIHGGAPWSASGYATQTKLFAPRLQAAGHDVAVSCWHGLTGGHDVDGKTVSMEGPRGLIPLYPGGYTEYSFDMVPDYYKHWEADVCISIIDAFVTDMRAVRDVERFIPLYPVDSEPLAPAVKYVLERVPERWVISRYGERVTNEAGLSATYVPAAFDPVYQPEGDSIRDLLGLSDRYVVGVVAANKSDHPAAPARKSWPQIFEGFAEFHKRVPEAVLYVHSFTGQQHHGLDLPAVAASFGLDKAKVIWSSALGMHLGYASVALASLYRSFDVLLNPAMGEGFGVPIAEAQACGVPVIVGDWTAMSEVAKTGIRIPKSSALQWNWNIPARTNMWIPYPTAIADALTEAYEKTGTKSWPSPAEISKRVQEYAADRVVTEHMLPALEAPERHPVNAIVPNRKVRRREKIQGKAAT